MPLTPHRLAARVAEALGSEPDVLDAYLFGSRARGDDREESDVDVAVFLDPQLSPALRFARRIELATNVMGALQRSDLDLVVLNDVTPLLYHRVLRDGIRVIARDPVACAGRAAEAISRFCDDVPRLRLLSDALARRIRAGAFGR